MLGLLQEMILTPDQARRKAVAACQAAITKRGVAVLIVPVDVSDSDAPFQNLISRCITTGPSSVRATPHLQRRAVVDAFRRKPGHHLRWVRLSRGAHDEIVRPRRKNQGPRRPHYAGKRRDRIRQSLLYRHDGHGDWRRGRLSRHSELRHTVVDARRRLCLAPVLIQITPILFRSRSIPPMSAGGIP